ALGNPAKCAGFPLSHRLGGGGRLTKPDISLATKSGRFNLLTTFSNAGHLPPLWYHAAERAWGWLEEGTDAQSRKVSGLPVGLISGADYRQTIVTLKPLDLLVLYTDGITEAENGSGQELGREQLLEWARQAPVDSPRALGETLFQQLELFRGRSRNDDETLLVLQREEESLLSMLGEVASSNTFGRLRRSPEKSQPETSPQFRFARRSSTLHESILGETSPSSTKRRQYVDSAARSHLSGPDGP
ncbi:MAG: PP2C family protein-serine/threonine phosphatase, partial [Candidatus Sulfotelmatobacter sp.]